MYYSAHTDKYDRFIVTQDEEEAMVIIHSTLELKLP